MRNQLVKGRRWESMSHLKTGSKSKLQHELSAREATALAQLVPMPLPLILQDSAQQRCVPVGTAPSSLWVRQKGDNLSVHQQGWAEKLWYRHTMESFMSLLSYSPNLLASSIATISKTYPNSISFPLLPMQSYHHHLSPGQLNQILHWSPWVHSSLPRLYSSHADRSN